MSMHARFVPQPRRPWVPLAMVGILLALATHARASAPPASEATALFARYCNECHGGSKARGDLALDVYADLDEIAVRADRAVWLSVKERLEQRDMPPEDHAQPSEEERTALLAWLGGTLATAEATRVDPGRVTVRRLNRVEYRNTIRDLVGVDFPVERHLPGDNVGYGFDNIGDVLSTSPLLLERYLSAAEYIAEQALPAGPVDPTTRHTLPLGHQRLVPQPLPTHDWRKVARRDLSDFLLRAFRRPPRRAEVNRLLGLLGAALREGAGYSEGMRRALAATLVSPAFLFRIERDPRGMAAGRPYALDDFELATRLSYFLWSTTPDDALLAEATAGTLRTNLAPQTRRMLADPRAKSLVENFVGQWLQLRKLDSRTPDLDEYPAFDESLRAAMRRETELFFTTIMDEDRDVLDLVDGDFTFVNERLARHYGMSDVSGDGFRRVSLEGTGRAGVLTHASILTITSNAGGTSPVKRGKFVLERVLGTPPPPPPPNTPGLRETKKGLRGETLTLRQLMERHRQDPGCATCHTRMDSFGFALETFDAIGAARTHDKNGIVIDASGTLPGGITFNGAGEMRKVLRNRAPQFLRALGEAMMTYAIGRGMERADRPAIEAVVRHMQDNDRRFSSLVMGIVTSDPFTKRRAAAPATATAAPAKSRGERS